MFCRRAWQRLAPLAKRAFKPAFLNGPPVRRMAFGVPGGSTNMAYFVLCGGGLTAAVVYAYKTVNDDSERYEDRLANMSSKTAFSSEAEPEESVPAAEPASVESAPVAEITSEDSAPAPELASEESVPTPEPPSVESAPAAEPASVESAPVAEITSEDSAPAPELASEDSAPAPELASEESVPTPEPPSVESAPAAEPAPAEEETEVAPVAESVPAASEPVAEISADPVTEAPSEEVLASEAVVEEAAAPEEEEGALDTSPVEMSAAPAAESTDVLSAVKLVASSMAEIAAASVGEESSVDAVPHAEVDGIGLNAEVEALLEASEEEPHPAGEVDPKAANDGPAEDEEAADEKEISEDIHPIEEPGFILFTEAPPEDAAPSEEPSPVEELTHEQTMPEEIPAADTVQLAADSTGPDLEAAFTPEPETECCPACHSAPAPGGEELRPPADAPARDLEENTSAEAKEESSSLVGEQTTNSLAVLTAGL